MSVTITAPASERVAGGVGESRPRVDGIPKAVGAFTYASDLRAEGMLHGATTGARTRRRGSSRSTPAPRWRCPACTRC